MGSQGDLCAKFARKMEKTRQTRKFCAFDSQYSPLFRGKCSEMSHSTSAPSPSPTGSRSSFSQKSAPVRHIKPGHNRNPAPIEAQARVAEWGFRAESRDSIPQHADSHARHIREPFRPEIEHARNSDSMQIRARRRSIRGSDRAVNQYSEIRAQ